MYNSLVLIINFYFDDFVLTLTIYHLPFMTVLGFFLRRFPKVQLIYVSTKSLKKISYLTKRYAPKCL